MLWVVLGAGASFDSIDSVVCPAPFSVQSTLRFRPPVTNGLFVENSAFAQDVQNLPWLQPILPELRRFSGRTDVSIETQLREYDDQSATSLIRTKQLASIRIYLWQRLAASSQWGQAASGVTNYAALVGRLMHWQEGSGEPIAFVTFNYDLLLEDALTPYLTITSLGDYVSGYDNLKLVKAHGSVNWAHPYRGWTGDAKRFQVDEVDSIDIPASDFRLVAPLQFSNGDWLHVPAIAVPVDSNKTFECPDDQTRFLRDTASSVKRMLVVGWAGGDQHFLELLSACGCRPSKIVIACGSADGSRHTNARLASAIPGINSRPVTSGFTDLLRPTPGVQHPLDYLLS